MGEVAGGGTPVDQMTEDELLARARKAMLRAAALPVGSLGRSVQWAVYDTYEGELRRRALSLAASIGTGGTR